MEELIKRRNPRANIEKFPVDFTELDFNEKEEILENSDLIIVTTDSPACQFAVNEVAYELGVPALFVGCYERASAGEIIYVLPRITNSCYDCIAGFRREYAGETKLKERRRAYSNEDPDKVPAQPGLAVDISLVVAIASGYALAILEPGSTRSVLLNPEENIVLIHSGNAPTGEFADMFDRPFETRQIGFPEDPVCPVCHKEEYIKSLRRHDYGQN